MEAGKRTINDIFNGAKILEIPFFQRSYVWGEEQWERFLDDMYDICANNNVYFLGSVILKQILTTDKGVGDRRIVIDGQQRLTTLNIFFKIISLLSDKQREFNRTFRLLDDNIALKHNHNDISSFEKIMNLDKLEEINKKDAISLCYNYFYKNIDIEKISFNTLIQKILFIGIEIVENEDEQQIFDTINSLGVKLTTAELLKNYFFNKDNFSMYDSYWKNIYETDDEIKEYWDTEITAGRIKRTLIDIFLFSYLQIKIQTKTLNLKTEEKINLSKVEHLFQSFKYFISNFLNNDKESVLKELKEYAIIFKNNINPKIISDHLNQESSIDRINALIFGLENSTLIPYTLYVLKHNSNEQERKELFGCIETFIMRRIICRTNNKSYNNLFTDRLIFREIIKKQDFIKHIDTQDDKVNFMPNNDELLEGFNNSVLSNKAASGVLYLIESKIRTTLYNSTKLLGISKYSLEHLMPKKWENNWGKLEEKEEIDKRNRKLLTLGNLAIITQNLNSKIRDLNWEVKKNGTNNNGLKNYTRDLETINKYLDLTTWDESEIEKRALDLYNYALDIWKI